MIHRIKTLIIKELQALFNDPQGRKLLFMPVVIQLLLFPGAATLEVKNNTMAVLNEDNGRASFELVQRFSQAKAFSKMLILQSDDELRRVIEEQRALLVVRFSPDFSRRLAAGQSPSVQVILDGRRSNTAQIALGYVQDIFATYSAEISKSGNASAGRSTITTRHWFNPNLNHTWFVLPSLIATITTASTLIITSLSVAREREQGTFDQLLVSPLTPGMIMLGKAIPAAIVSIIQATIVLLTGAFFYEIPFQGSLVLLYGSMAFYIAAVVGFGLFISSLCSTQQQAFLGVFTFMMPAILLSGFSAPIDNMPPWLQMVTWANPLQHFITIVKGVFLKDIGTSAVLASTWPMLVIAIVTISAADIAFRRRVG